MIKDEIKNRISLALKDPILQQGFEIICKELEQEKKLNEEIKVRFVKCNTCTPDMKEKCLMFNENLCEGERCEELIDLMALVNKNDLQKENEQLKQQVEKMKCCYNCSKWNDGECEESPKSKTFFCADFKCDEWECIE